jgi:hypothetical protein
LFTLLAVLVLLQRRVTLPRWDPLTGRRASLAALALSSNTKDALSSSILLTGKLYYEIFFISLNNNQANMDVRFVDVLRLGTGKMQL